MGCYESKPAKPVTPAPRAAVGPRLNLEGLRNTASSDRSLLSLEGRNVRAQDPKDKAVLGVEAVNLLVAENTVPHHTDQFDITDPEELPPNVDPKLVIRRGQPFDLDITFNRPYDKSKDELRLVFQSGPKPTASKGTHVEIILSDRDDPKKWGAKIRSQKGDVLGLTVFTPPTCYVAKWSFKLDVLKKENEKKTIFRYSHKDDIYILFNPWCKDDAVYMAGDLEKDEYVLNESGHIYSGSAGNISNKPWLFEQFQDNVLDCCMYLLDESNLKMTSRGDPVPVVRKITAVVNAPDDYGVLVGNWSGNYAGGTSPLSWTGSGPILEEYYRTKNPVQFGQCWVFSGVTTTVCRALGIPARSVTNFASAHDTDGSISIDAHFDENGEPDAALNDDSVWNFHVWNEAWMTRPDLPTGYGGWQAMDATPQEASDNVYCCGPVPVLAIKRGEVNLPFDGQFVFAEVNGDRVYWTVHPDGSTETAYIDKRSVGKNISTKSLTGDREDVTLGYKFPEGSEEERIAVRKAAQVGSSRQDIYVHGEQDVTFELDHTKDVFVGEDFFSILKITNKSKENRKITGRLACQTMYYTGVIAEHVCRTNFEIEVGAGQCKETSLEVKYENYQDKLRDMCMLMLTGQAKVEKTRQIYTNMNPFRLRKPHLLIKAPDTGTVQKQLTATVTFTNPLAESLTGCTLQVNGPGLLKPQTLRGGDIPTTVGPKQTFSASVNFTPKKKGKRTIVIIFGSKQLEDINGTHTLTVKPK